MCTYVLTCNMLFLVVQCMRLCHLLREHKHRTLDHHHLATAQLKLASGECECTKLVYADTLDREKEDVNTQ